MNTQTFEYPALYGAADEGSNTAQRSFLWTIRLEYFLLFVISVISSFRVYIQHFEIIVTFILFALGGIFTFKVIKKLDQDWYRCRALAESVKTSAWRFSMRAHPFEDADSVNVPKANFRNLLNDILKSNKGIAERLTASEEHQVTKSMIFLRGLPVKERLGFYVKNRIDEQRRWYARKSGENKKAMNIWITATLIVYALCLLSLNSKIIGIPQISISFDPLIVLVTSFIGWIQIKRHSELTASYNLTAHEIGIIHGKAESVKSESELSDFVNESELAFSREHTQWVARRDVN